MASLSPIEKRNLESLLQMGGGYVLDFSNRTFQEFVVYATGKDIYEGEYAFLGESKANRLRAFWKIEADPIVGKLLDALLEYSRETHSGLPGTELYDDCQEIANRLTRGASVEDIDAISQNSAEKEFQKLEKAIRDAVNAGDPESVLDRLHTYLVKYVRLLCKKHSISTPTSKPLHSLFGEYVKFLKRDMLIDSDMSQRILKSTISLLESFNRVRNEHSLAHDNAILSQAESLLIVRCTIATIRFIRELEGSSRRPTGIGTIKVEEKGDLPF